MLHDHTASLSGFSLPALRSVRTNYVRSNNGGSLCVGGSYIHWTRLFANKWQQTIGYIT